MRGLCAVTRGVGSVCPDWVDLTWWVPLDAGGMAVTAVSLGLSENLLGVFLVTCTPSFRLLMYIQDRRSVITLSLLPKSLLLKIVLTVPIGIEVVRPIANSFLLAFTLILAEKLPNL